MLFNSFTFFAFFAVVYLSYLALKGRLRLQNLLLLVASYVFYASWDWRFLGLILVSTLVDFFVGREISSTSLTSKKRTLLTVSIVTNLGILGFFKYFNFFAESFAGLLQMFGMSADYVTLNIILPVGISFYTFQSMSYTIDIYRGRLKPTQNFPDFALFVAFFPQLVAGPIERARNLLPQIQNHRKIRLENIDAGIFLIIWGLFKKVVIADNVGLIANDVFAGSAELQGIDLIIGILAFTIQIYCDFSGYSDIARGLCKLMGFELMVNFRLPYFAKNPSDFWQRWHISLSSWLRDYLYISLGGNREGKLIIYRNLMVTMLLGGLWHGAAWNFVIWGGYHGLLLILYRVVQLPATIKQVFSITPSRVFSGMQVALMFVLTMIGWVFFRAESVEQITHILSHMFIISAHFNFDNAYELAYFFLPLLAMQICQHRSGNLLILLQQNMLVRGLGYAFAFIGMLVFTAREPLEFIYFQF